MDSFVARAAKVSATHGLRPEPVATAMSCSLLPYRSGCRRQSDFDRPRSVAHIRVDERPRPKSGDDQGLGVWDTARIVVRNEITRGLTIRLLARSCG